MLGTIIGRAGASPPSHYAGADFYICHPAIAGSITSGYLVAVERDRLSELGLSTSYKQVLASVLRLMIQTTPLPYLISVHRAATVRCVITRSKG